MDVYKEMAKRMWDEERNGGGQRGRCRSAQLGVLVRVWHLAAQLAALRAWHAAAGSRARGSCGARRPSSGWL